MLSLGDGDQLVPRGLGSTIPRLIQIGDAAAENAGGCGALDHARRDAEIRRSALRTGGACSSLVNLFKGFAARRFFLLRGGGDGFDFSGERIDARIAVLPRVDEQRFIEGAGNALDFRQFEKPGFRGNQQANGKLNGRNIFDEIEIGERFEQIAIAFERSPGSEGDEGRLQGEAELAEFLRNVNKIGARVALFEFAKHCVIERFDGAGDEQAIRFAQRGEMTFVLPQMFDFDGGVISERRKFSVQFAHDGEGMADAVEKIGIAKGDVLGSSGDLLADIGENGFLIDDAENTVVDGDDGAVAA